MINKEISATHVFYNDITNSCLNKEYLEKFIKSILDKDNYKSFFTLKLDLKELFNNNYVNSVGGFSYDIGTISYELQKHISFDITVLQRFNRFTDTALHIFNNKFFLDKEYTNTMVIEFSLENIYLEDLKENALCAKILFYPHKHEDLVLAEFREIFTYKIV